MRTAKLKLMAAVSVATVGLIGTGAIVVVGQEKKPAEGGKPAPAAKAETGKPDPAWNKSDEVTAFPNIKPLGSDEVKDFAAKHVPLVLESDPPLRKLQKARLRVAMEELINELQFRNIGDPRVPFETTIPRIDQATRAIVTSGVELAERREDQRAWLAFGVGVLKGNEAFITARVKNGIARPTEAFTVRRHRLDAEIALLKHAQQREAK